MVPRLELRPSWESSVSAADSPDTHGHCSRLAGWEESTSQRSASQSNWCMRSLTSAALLEKVVRSQEQLPRHLTSRLVSAVPWGMGVVKKHPSVYRHLSRAGLDPPGGSVPGIAPFPRHCQGIWLGAVCSCSSSVMHSSAEKGLNWTY